MAESIRAAVSELLDSVGIPDDAAVEGLIERLAEPEVTLGARTSLPELWRRRMTVPTGDYSQVRVGLHPGDSYTQSYDRYRINIDTGRRLVSVASNGGPWMDPDFFVLHGDWIEIRAANDAHRNELIDRIETQVERANNVVETWNTDELPNAVRRELDRQQRSRQHAEKRTDEKTAAGFPPAPPSRSQPIPLPDTKRPAPTTRPTTPDGHHYHLTAEQFDAILDCVRAHRNSVERNPGSGAPPDAPEDDHRDQVLQSLNVRFQDATGESFSSQGKTDIRLVVDNDAYLFFECKIWGGVSDVDEALAQLLGKYLTPRDRFGVIVLFVRDRTEPELLPPKALAHIENKHDGTRLDDIQTFPVLDVPVPQTGRSVTVAVVFIQVDSAPPRT